MNDGEYPRAGPPSPEEAARSRRIIRTLAVLFVVVSLFVFVWGLFVVQGTRGRAVQSDAGLRSMAWAMLCYAEQHNGVFPTSQGVLTAVTTCESLPAGIGWPGSKVAAMEGLTYMPVAEAADFVSVTWPPHGELPPVLAAKSGVSRFGTLALANGWLTQFAQARAQANAPTVRPGSTPPAADPAAQNP